MALSITSARKIIGKEAKSLTDPDVQLLLDQFYGLAEIISNMVSVNGSNNDKRVIDSDLGKGQNGLN
jgi:hypothetical protein